MFSVLCIFACASAAATGQVMTGQPRHVPVNSSEVVAAARFAVAAYNRANAENQPVYELANITSAQFQVVAGINYILEVDLEPVVGKSNETVGGKTWDFDFKYTTMRE